MDINQIKFEDRSQLPQNLKDQYYPIFKEKIGIILKEIYPDIFVNKILFLWSSGEYDPINNSDLKTFNNLTLETARCKGGTSTLGGFYVEKYLNTHQIIVELKMDRFLLRYNESKFFETTFKEVLMHELSHLMHILSNEDFLFSQK